MSADDFINILAKVVASVSGAGVLLFALSSWPGKVWAARILEGDRKKYAEELEYMKTQWHVETEKLLAHHRDKIELYRAATRPITELLADINNKKLTKASLDSFDSQRLLISANLAMFAPQEVMDAYDTLIDYLYSTLEGSKPYDWKIVRDLSYKLLNKMRSDIGISKGEIAYRGQR